MYNSPRSSLHATRWIKLNLNTCVPTPIIFIWCGADLWSVWKSTRTYTSPTSQSKISRGSTKGSTACKQQEVLFRTEYPPVSQSQHLFPTLLLFYTNVVLTIPCPILYFHFHFYQLDSKINNPVLSSLSQWTLATRPIGILQNVNHVDGRSTQLFSLSFRIWVIQDFWLYVKYQVCSKCLTFS
jgi:hypothetical protein